MAYEAYSRIDSAELLAARLNIDLAADIEDSNWRAVINYAEAVSPDPLRTSYTFHRIDYIDSQATVMASRMIAEIPPAGKTEPAYFMGGSNSNHPWQQIDIHAGIGQLVLGVPGEARPIYIDMDASSMTNVMLPTDVFYFMRADSHTDVKLITSSLFRGQTDWEQIETALEPHEVTVSPPSRLPVTVPIAFYAETIRAF